jgi:hypothetical protein
MKQSFLLLTSTAFLFSCKSFSEKVKDDKEKFIQVAKENSQPIDVDNLGNIYQMAKANNTEGKIKALGIDNVQTVYSLSNNSELGLDSIVIFSKADYRVLYDFASAPRDIGIIKQKADLKDFQAIDDRLFVGKK